MQVQQSLGQPIPRVTAMIAATAVATQLSTIIQYNTIQYNVATQLCTIIQYNTIQYNVQWWPEGGGWLCRVEVDSEQVSLEPFLEDSERLCGPENGCTRRPAEVVERRDRAGVCGFTNAWR